MQVSQNEIRTALESNDEDAKVEAMQKAITAILAGEQFPSLFITIVRYVLPSENHMVQKLLLLYLVSRVCLKGWCCSVQRVLCLQFCRCGRPECCWLLPLLMVMCSPSSRPLGPRATCAAGDH